MSDPLAGAFARTPLPPMSPDFERRVVTQALSSGPVRVRRIRGLLRAYWLAAGAASVAVIAATDAPTFALIAAAVSLAGVGAGAALAAGGLRHVARALRAAI
jgi:hypothetical protein